MLQEWDYLKDLRPQLAQGARGLLHDAVRPCPALLCVCVCMYKYRVWRGVSSSLFTVYTRTLLPKQDAPGGTGAHAGALAALCLLGALGTAAEQQGSSGQKENAAQGGQEETGPAALALFLAARSAWLEEAAAEASSHEGGNDDVSGGGGLSCVWIDRWLINPNHTSNKTPRTASHGGGSRAG